MSSHPVIDCIPGYRLLAEIGRGAFGVVWQAEETATGRHVALKTLPKSKTTERELDGIRSYFRARLRHPAILEIFHVNETDDFYYYTMELADDATFKPDGTSRNAEIESYHPFTLRLFLERETPVLPTRTLEIAVQILGGLAYLHANALIHRDVKPENVLFVNGQVKLGDWGLVASSDGNVTMIGTRGYLPPDDKLDYTADLYATGKIIYEMITGFEVARYPDLPNRRIKEIKELRAHGTAMRMIEWAAHRDRAKRAQSANQLLEQLASLKSPGYQRMRKLLYVVVSGLLLCLASWGVSSWFEKSPTGDSQVDSTIARAVGGRPLWNHEVVGHGFQISFRDGTTRDYKCRSPVRNVVVGDFWYGTRCIAVGMQATGPDAGKLMIFDEQACIRTTNPTPLLIRQPRNAPPTEWSFQEHPLACHIRLMPAADVDGKPGEELILAVQHDDGPCEVIVFSADARQIGSYWHYGWLDDMCVLKPPSDNTGAVLAFKGKANHRDSPLPYGRRDEALHSCLIVLDWNALSEQSGYWGSSDWLHQGSGAAPLAYGVISHQINQTDGRWDWGHFMVVGGGPETSLRIVVDRDLLLDLTMGLRPNWARYLPETGHDAEPPMDVNSIWERTWPPVANAVKDPPADGE